MHEDTGTLVVLFVPHVVVVQLLSADPVAATHAATPVGPVVVYEQFTSVQAFPAFPTTGVQEDAVGPVVTGVQVVCV